MAKIEYSTDYRICVLIFLHEPAMFHAFSCRSLACKYSRLRNDSRKQASATKTLPVTTKITRNQMANTFISENRVFVVTWWSISMCFVGL